jgi:hypothetical protein
MSTKPTKMLGLTIAAIALLLVTMPVLKIGVVYADNGDHGDHNNGDHGDHNNDRDHGDHNNGDHGDHNNGDHGDHDNDRND